MLAPSASRAANDVAETARFLRFAASVTASIGFSP
ncbi:hypothetical protein ABZS71_34185 [Streptomyces sp. NPDC005393]